MAALIQMESLQHPAAPAYGPNVQFQDFGFAMFAMQESSDFNISFLPAISLRHPVRRDRVGFPGADGIHTDFDRFGLRNVFRLS